MIIFLLVLIVLVLLFGAGAVRGVIRGTILYVGSGLLLFFGVLGIANIFGTSGGTILVICGGILAVLVFVGASIKADHPQDRLRPPSSPKRSSAPEPPLHVQEAIALDRKLRDEFKGKVERPRD